MPHLPVTLWDVAASGQSLHLGTLAPIARSERYRSQALGALGFKISKILATPFGR